MNVQEAVARATLVAAPLLAFRVFPLPGIFTLAMILPLAVLTATYISTTGNRLPAWELALLTVMASSVLWGDEPAYSTERLRTYLPLLLATTVAASLVSGPTVLRCLKIAFVIIVGSSMLRILLDPSGGVRSGSVDLGLTAQFAKNVYGGLLVVALVLLVDTTRRLNLVLAPVLVVLLALNRSATAWVVAFLLVVATYASRRVISRMGPRSSRPILAVFILVGLGGAALLTLSDFDSVVGALGKDPTLGKRTDIWAACWEQVKAAPLLGHGAFTFLDSASNSPVTQFVWSRFQGYQPPHPHNGFLDLVGQLGMVGVIAFTGLMVHGVKRGARGALLGVESARTAVLCLGFIILFGVTEPTYLGAWLVVTVMCVAIADERPGTAPPTKVAHERRTLTSVGDPISDIRRASIHEGNDDLGRRL